MQAKRKSAMVSTGTRKTHNMYNEKTELIFSSRLSNIKLHKIFFFYFITDMLVSQIYGWFCLATFR